MTPLILINNVEVKQILKKRISLKPEGKSIKFDLIVDWEKFTLSLLIILIVIR